MTTNGSSFDNVWDDSSLLNTWDEAVAEYKKYHSLAAKGETIPVEPPVEEPQQPTPDEPSSTQQHQPPLANSSLDAPLASSGAEVKDEPQPASAKAPVQGAAAAPQALLGTVQDEGMKSLMMSWYYAGYYTGLFEGKQAAYTEIQQGG